MSPEDKSELLDLAEMLEKKAKWCDARKSLAAHDPTYNAQKEAQHAAYCRRKADVCRRAAGPQPRNKSLASAPTLGEWLEYAVELKWPAADATACWDHFQSCGWRIGQGSGKTMRDWKSTARNGHRRWLKDHPAASNGAQHAQDPAGWREWLAALPRAYMAYRLALPYLQKEFNDSRK